MKKKQQQQKTGKKLSYFYKLKFVISSCLEKRLLPKNFLLKIFHILNTYLMGNTFIIEKP